MQRYTNPPARNAARNAPPPPRPAQRPAPQPKGGGTCAVKPGKVR